MAIERWRTTMNVTESLVAVLEAEGVEYCVGFPSNPLFDTGKAEEAGIRTIITRQERTALHMADGIGRVSSGEEIAAFACQHGPGTENSIGGVAQAYAESAPLVAIPAGYDRSGTDVDPRFNSFLTYQPVSKTCEQLTDPDAVDETMRRAFNAARNGRPRPSVVEVPKDVFGEEVSSFDYTPTEATSPGPDPDGIEAIADVLLTADNPVLYAGQGVHYAQAWEPLRKLAETLEAPVGTSLNGKSAFPEDHPLALGAGSKSEPAALHQFIQEADVIFGVGCSFTDTAYGITVPPEKTVIHSTLDAGDIDKDVVSEYSLVGDAKLTLSSLVSAVQARVDGPRGRRDDVAAKINAITESWLEEWRPKLTSDAMPINPYRVVNELDNVLDKESSIVTHDAGNARDFMAPFYEATEPLSYVGWGKTTQLGYGLGLMMGAKLVHPEKTCVHIMGDGAIGMTGMDFETAAREEIPIIEIVLNNFEMASYDTPFSGHYADFAESLGGYGERIERPENIADAIERGVERTKSGTPVLLEFLTAKETDKSIF